VSAIAVLLVFAFLWAVVPWRVGAGDADWLPAELRKARLVFSEQTFVTARPFLLGAIVDRVYRRPDGVLVLLEFKRRDQLAAYQSDIVELSAQKLALTGATRERVAEHAYVAIADETGIPARAVRVGLLSLDQVAKSRERYLALLRDEVNPAKTNRLALCARCAYLSACKDSRQTTAAVRN
jgi:CRISPR-associated exonuclease Cas4